MAYKLVLQLFHFQVMFVRNTYLVISNLNQMQILSLGKNKSFNKARL